METADMLFTRYLAIALLPLSLCTSAQPAPTPDLKPGVYVSTGGWGTLDIKRAKGSGLPFSLQATGVNGHSCDMEGTIVAGIATLKVDEPGPSCRVKFSVTPKGVDVQDLSGDAICHNNYCGMRAGFIGEYLVPVAGCRPDQVHAARDKFKAAYQARQYQAAAKLLVPLVNDCQLTLGPWEGYDIQNDLAVTYYHLRDKAKCLATLTPLIEIAEADPASFKEEYPPSDADSMLAVHKAAATNLRLCRGLK